VCKEAPYLRQHFHHNVVRTISAALQLPVTTIRMNGRIPVNGDGLGPAMADDRPDIVVEGAGEHGLHYIEIKTGSYETARGAALTKHHTQYREKALKRYARPCAGRRLDVFVVSMEGVMDPASGKLLERIQRASDALNPARKNATRLAVTLGLACVLSDEYVRDHMDARQAASYGPPPPRGPDISALRANQSGMTFPRADGGPDSTPGAPPAAAHTAGTPGPQLGASGRGRGARSRPQWSGGTPWIGGTTWVNGRGTGRPPDPPPPPPDPQPPATRNPPAQTPALRADCHNATTAMQSPATGPAGAQDADAGHEQTSCPRGNGLEAGAEAGAAGGPSGTAGTADGTAAPVT